MQIFLKGLLLGFSIAAPVGPIGVLCIRRTLAEGRLVGFLSGLGAATADMLYGAIAAFGLSALQVILVGQANWLRSRRRYLLDISWRENLFVKTSRASRAGFTRRSLSRVSFHLIAHTHEPDDHSLVHRHLRRVANQQHERKLSFTDTVSGGGLLRVSGLVADSVIFGGAGSRSA